MYFNELNIKEGLISDIKKKGFEEMTDIQKESIPPALEGRDILGQAQTGTGKTAAFLIPIINQLHLDQKSTQSLILVPTRELALQVYKEAESLGDALDVRALAVYGGDSIDRQIQGLKRNPHIVVATPGRAIDLINRKKLKLNHINFFCLDEVDEMLNMGFIEDIEFISSVMPKEKQTLLFSATMPDRIKKITQKYLIDPKIIKVKSKSIVADKVDQSYIIVKQKQKLLVLKNLIDLNKGNKIIIFAQTKRSTDEIHEFLQGQGLKVGKIHGDLPQNTRTKTIQSFRDGNLDYLVATDVVARGIDIDNIDLVINFELPQDIEYYIHRIGRTARGTSAKGRAITLVSPNIYNKEFKHYERQLNVKIKEEKKPELNDVIGALQGRYLEEISQDRKKSERAYQELASNLLEQMDAVELVEQLLIRAYPELSKEATLKTISKIQGDDSKRNNGNNRGGRNKRRSNSGRNDGRSNNRGNSSRGDRNNGGNRNKSKKNKNSRKSSGKSSRKKY